MTINVSYFRDSLNSRGILFESSSTNSASPSPTSSTSSFVSFAMQASTLFPVSSDQEFNDVNEKLKKKEFAENLVPLQNDM